MNEEEKLTLTVTEAAKKLGLCRNSAYMAVISGELPSIRIGRRILIPKVAVQRLLENAGKEERGDDNRRAKTGNTHL